MSDQYKAQDAKVLKSAMQKDFVSLQTNFNKALSDRIADIARAKYQE